METMVSVSAEQLIASGVVVREYKNIGCCNRSELNFVAENNRYKYQNGRPLSKILSNKISNPLFKRLVLNMDKNAVKRV